MPDICPLLPQQAWCPQGILPHTVGPVIAHCRGYQQQLEANSVAVLGVRVYVFKYPHFAYLYVTSSKSL